MDRYGKPFEYGGRLVVLCRECSGRTARITGIMIEADERYEHDLWHHNGE